MGRSGMGQGTLEEVGEGSGDPRGSSGMVVEPLRRSGMGRGTIWEV